MFLNFFEYRVGSLLLFEICGVLGEFTHIENAYQVEWHQYNQK